MKKFLLILLILILSISLLSACKSKASSLEEMVKTDTDLNSKIENVFNGSGLDADVNIVDNTINIVIDIEDELKDIEVTDENKKLVVESFEDSFSNKDKEFAKIITNIEEQSGLENVLIRVSIIYKDKELWAITYNKDGMYNPKEEKE